VIGLGDFAVSAVDWENQRQLTQQEILGGLYMLAKWGRDGHPPISRRPTARLTKAHAAGTACTLGIFFTPTQEID
jgi:hypothetical protein